MSTPERFDKLEKFIRLWRNECLRVFHDRLIDEKDKEIIQGLLKKLAEENFSKIEEHITRDPCLFGDYRNALQVCDLVFTLQDALPWRSTIYDVNLLTILH